MPQRSCVSMTATLVFVVVCATPYTAKATLINRGNGLIYDTDLHITWLQDTNYAQTAGYDTDGNMLYSQEQAFIAYLNSTHFLGYSDWRLPQVETPCLDYGCTNSELGHVYYTELGNPSAEPASHAGPFMNLCFDCVYWTGTPFAPGFSYHFLFAGGQQGFSGTDDTFGNAYRVMVVRDGDVPDAAPDADGDGVSDEGDACPNSDVSPTVVIDGCDSQAENDVLPDGCTIADLVIKCFEDASMRLQVRLCATRLLHDLWREGAIRLREAVRIRACLVRSLLP